MNVINLGILAHVDAGKTTLTEGMLFQAGCIRKMGNVDDGTTVTDSMDLEKKRGMTIKSSVISFEWNHMKINLIDTPGHFDFLSQVESVLHVLDIVVLVIAAREGVQPQTRLFFRKLSELKIPTVIFINKLDRMGVDYEDLIKTIRTKLTDEILECQRYHGVGGKQVEIEDIPLEDEELQMKLLLSSETLIAKYDESREITTKEYETELIRLIRGGKLYPVLGGVALKNQGITGLMNMLTKIMADGKPQTDKLSAYVFKVDFDQKGQKRIFFRVFSGTVIVRQNVYIKNDEFRRLVPIALKKALNDAAVEILEPWQNFIISVPAYYDKTVLNDICKMKARITEYQYGETETCFIGKALLQDMMNYESRLNILTHGSASILQDFFKYLPMDESVEALMEKYK